MTVKNTIEKLRDLGWTYTRIGSHYGVSEREVARWAMHGAPPRAEKIPPPSVIDYKTTLVVNDTQYPYHDHSLWETTCQIAADNEIEEIVYAGDMLDFPQLSSFKFDPHKTNKAKDDVIGFHEDLRLPLLDGILSRTLDEWWVNGNHEHRYERYLEQHSALEEAHSVKFLELDGFKGFYPYGHRIGHYLTPELAVVHGWETGKTTALRNHMSEMGCSVIHGHTHRVSQVRKYTGSRLLAGYEVGHMGDYAKIPGAHGKGQPDWQQVAGTLVYSSRNGDSFNVDVLEVFGKNSDRVWANGKVYHIER